MKPLQLLAGRGQRLGKLVSGGAKGVEVGEVQFYSERFHRRFPLGFKVSGFLSSLDGIVTMVVPGQYHGVDVQRRIAAELSGHSPVPVLSDGQPTGDPPTFPEGTKCPIGSVLTRPVGTKDVSLGDEWKTGDGFTGGSNPANTPPTDCGVQEAAGAANGDRIAAKAQLSAFQR